MLPLEGCFQGYCTVKIPSSHNVGPIKVYDWHQQAAFEVAESSSEQLLMAGTWQNEDDDGLRGLSATSSKIVKRLRLSPGQPLASSRGLWGLRTTRNRTNMPTGTFTGAIDLYIRQ